MTPPKLLTVDEIIELKKSYVLFGDVGDDLETLLETALAAMRCKDLMEHQRFCCVTRFIGKPCEICKEKIDEALKPFQQTGEDKK